MDFKKLSSEELRKHKGISFTGITTVFYCHDGKGNLFLAKRSNNARDEHGRWDVGGGGLKHGQSVEDSLKRELIEEYDVVPKKIDFMNYYDAFRETPDGMPTHWVALNFACLVDPKEVKINETDMFDDFGWFKLANLPKPLHSQLDKFVDKYGDVLRNHINI
ncbi:MAG: 8-oxo-dGTP diphosphatase [Patescibacteria group bacterium]|nr:8-oxo-dGTP diphosphatase [Patescibacteria group bacterium]